MQLYGYIMNFFEKLDGDILRDLGAQLKQLRKANKYSQQQLADRIGSSRKLIVDIEAGKGTSVLILIKILKVFGRTDRFLEIFKSSSISPRELFLKENK